MPQDPNITLAQTVRQGGQQAQSFADLSRRVQQLEREHYAAMARKKPAHLSGGATLAEVITTLNEVIDRL